MATSLNAGFSNNINVLQLRSSGTSLQRLTDRDLPGIVTLGTDPPTPPGVARSVIDSTVEPDGGVVHDNQTVTEFTTGGN